MAASGLCALSGPALADASAAFESASGRELPAYLQCVPYARQLSGVQIYGDAHTWWDQAAGRYERGDEPRVGAVMAFVPHGSMRLGHVATVSRVIDSRTVLLDHANWSPINGRRGQIERDVRAIDVSPGNDWSQVRVWYDPIQALGTTVWPVHGFIYGEEARLPETRLAAASPSRAAPAPQAPARPVSTAPSRAFMSAFSGMAAPAPVTRRSGTVASAPARKAMPQRKVAVPAPRDPIAAAVARYGN
nr:CHAP domain-containing protein [Pelagerythrobacter rhizovicinus]